MTAWGAASIGPLINQVAGVGVRPRPTLGLEKALGDAGAVIHGCGTMRLVSFKYMRWEEFPA